MVTFISSLLFILIVPNLAVLPYFLKHYRSGTPMTPDILVTDKTLVLIFILAYIPVHILTFAVAWAVATRLGRLPFRATTGWSWPKDFGLVKSVGFGLLLLVFTWVLSALVARILGQQKTDMERIIESSKGAALTLAFLAAFTAPLVEETVYRGVLYPPLKRAIGAIGAVFMVSSLFAGLHILQYWPNAAAISAVTILSVVLTIVRARTGRLLPCFVIHLTFNGVQSAIIVIATFWPDIERLVLRRNQAGLLINLFHY